MPPLIEISTARGRQKIEAVNPPAKSGFVILVGYGILDF